MELLTSYEMSRADALAVGMGVESFALMTAAGRAVAQACEAIVPDGPIVVVAGLGNNGGDGFVAATELAQLGRSVKVVLVGHRADLKGDAARAAAGWAGEIVEGDLSAIGRPALVVDALFGAGLNRPVEGDAKAAIDAMNGAGAPVLAVDLPSGIDGNTGEIMGAAVRATETVTFFRRKPAHLLLPSRPLCGRVILVDIGLPAAVLAKVQPDPVFENLPQFWRDNFPVPRVDGHKYSRGHAVVVSGGAATTGAARLAARAALRAGAGLATLASPRDALAVNAAAVAAVMVRPVDPPEELAWMLSDTRLNACVIGPGAGVGPRTQELVFAALESECAVVLDADALTSFQDGPEELFDAIKSKQGGRVILTPHEGEFVRLFNNNEFKYGLKSKLEKTRRAADVSGAVVLTKGADTTVSSPEGATTIAANAPPWLATAGAGDVLSGIIAGLLAQRVPPFAAASMGAWMHGDAAARFGPGLIAEDLTETLPAVIRGLYQRFGVAMSDYQSGDRA